MNDELTPEEKEALAKLPRERMPVGLEGRVVDAMRDHGFLAKRRRSIILTNTRVAGVLAAGVALIIGAYSVGLHRGDNEESRRLMTGMSAPAPASDVPAEYDEATPTPAGTAPAPAQDAGRLEAQEAPESPKSTVLQKERSRANQAPAKNEAPVSDDVASAPPATRADEAKKDVDSQAKAKNEEREEATTPTLRAPELGRTSDALAPSAMSLSEAVQRPLTFHLGGKTVVIEAPDIVRVVEDEPGKTILIYTSDGLIRIRVSD